VSRLVWTGVASVSFSARGRCLGDQLTAYADRAMDEATLLRWDRHVVGCQCCRAAVDEERRVLSALRSSAGSPVPGDLRGMLLALATQMPHPGPEGSTAPRAPMLPPIPAAPVPVVDRGTPALHRSAGRATVYAGLAAGATAAAALSLVVTGGLTSANPTAPPAVQRAKPASPGFATAAFTVPGLGGSASGTSVTPSVGTVRGRSAQSTP
jgi:hypothetical protein